MAETPVGFAFVRTKLRAITRAVASRTGRALGVRRDGALGYLSQAIYGCRPQIAR